MACNLSTRETDQINTMWRTTYSLYSRQHPNFLLFNPISLASVTTNTRVPQLRLKLSNQEASLCDLTISNPSGILQEIPELKYQIVPLTCSPDWQNSQSFNKNWTRNLPSQKTQLSYLTVVLFYFKANGIEAKTMWYFFMWGLEMCVNYYYNLKLSICSQQRVRVEWMGKSMPGHSEGRSGFHSAVEHRSIGTVLYLNKNIQQRFGTGPTELQMFTEVEKPLSHGGLSILLWVFGSPAEQHLVPVLHLHLSPPYIVTVGGAVAVWHFAILQPDAKRKIKKNKEQVTSYH